MVSRREVLAALVTAGAQFIPRLLAPRPLPPLPSFTLDRARQGETVESLLIRNGYVPSYQFVERYNANFCVRITQKRTGRFMACSIFVPPSGQPDARPNVGYPCITFRITVLQGRRWVITDPSTDFRTTRLTKDAKVTIIFAGYNPRLVTT